MGRSLRARKEVDYSDPGELTLSAIRRGSLRYLNPVEDSPDLVTNKAKSRKSEVTTTTISSPKRNSRASAPPAPTVEPATRAPTSKADKPPTGKDRNKAVAAGAAGATPKQSPTKRPRSRLTDANSTRADVGSGKENEGVDGAITERSKSKPAGKVKGDKSSAAGSKRKVSTAQGKQPTASTSSASTKPQTAGSRPQTAPAAFVSALIYQSPAPSAGARAAGASPTGKQSKRSTVEVLHESDDDDTPTPPQLLKRKTLSSPVAERPAELRARGGKSPTGTSPSAGSPSRAARSKTSPSVASPRSKSRQSSPVADTGIVVSPGRTTRKTAAATPRSSTPAKRQRVTALSTPAMSIAALLPRVPRPLPSPVTPGVTEAQEKFLAEMARLVGALENSATATGAIAGGTEVEEQEGGKEGGNGKGSRRESSQEVDYWKGRFEELSVIRETKVEEELELFRAHAADREKAAQELIATLRKQAASGGAAGAGKIASPASKVKTSVNTPATTASVVEADQQQSDLANSAYVRNLQNTLEHHRKLIRLYQNLSSLAIHVKQNEGTGQEGEMFTCTAVNHLHRRAVRFDLKVPADEDTDDFTYNATGNTHLLPEYMQHELSFTKKQCPLFLTKLLQNMFRS